MSLRDYLFHEEPGITLYCGDCRDVLPLLDKSDLVLTDPPYGVGASYKKSYSDERDTYWAWFLPVVSMMRDAATVAIVHHAVPSLRHVTGWDDVGVWSKPYSHSPRLGNSPIRPTWEPIYFFGIHALGVNTTMVANVFTFNPEGNGVGANKFGRERLASDPGEKHPFPKPIRLTTALIAGFSGVGAAVLDPFSGSGTTLEAAKQLGRTAIGIEIEPRYCEIAVKRLRQEVLPL